MMYVADGLDIPAEEHDPLGGVVALDDPVVVSGGTLTTTLLYPSNAGIWTEARWRCASAVGARQRCH